MKIHILVAVVTLCMTTPALSDEITNRDQLMAYLKEKVPDDQTISNTYKIGDTLIAHQNNNGCLSTRTLDQMQLPTYLALRDGLIQVRVTKEDTAYRPYGGGGASCVYEITGFNVAGFTSRGGKFTREKGKPLQVTVPLFKQRLLGVENTDFQGHTSISGDDCDVSFIPVFKNTEPSKFALTYTEQFKQSHRYKNAFKTVSRSSMWCFQRQYDGSYKWKRWSRL